MALNVDGSDDFRAWVVTHDRDGDLSVASKTRAKHNLWGSEADRLSSAIVWIK